MKNYSEYASIPCLLLTRQYTLLESSNITELLAIKRLKKQHQQENNLFLGRF